MQVRDLELGQRLKMLCKACGHVHYLALAQIMYDLDGVDVSRSMAVAELQLPHIHGFSN